MAPESRPSGEPARARRPAPRRHVRPKVAVDCVALAFSAGKLRSYLAPLRRGALQGRWAFPGGLVRVGETLDQAVRRELFAAGGLGGESYLEQLFTFGDPARDPAAHVVSVAYLALVPGAAGACGPGADYPPGRWFDASALPPLAYDHGLMAEYAIQRLRAKLAHTNIAYALLPKEFTFAQLQELYEGVMGREIDRRNFRRRILAMGILHRGSAALRGPHRPAALYHFARQRLQTVEML